MFERTVRQHYRLMKILYVIPLLFVVGTCITSAQTNSATNITAHANRPSVYDESADGSKQIADALTVAIKENKRVLVLFGGNACVPCLLFHKLLESDEAISSSLKTNFVVVVVDISIRSRNGGQTFTRYKNGIDSIPLIVILDTDGRRLISKNAVDFMEDGHHSPQKVLKFLERWALKGKG